MISRIPLSPAARARVALAGGVLLAVGLALAPGPWASGSLRAAAMVCAIGGAAYLLRSGKLRPSAGARLAVLARQPLSRDVGVALLDLDGRHVLVGFGAGGVQLLERGSVRDRAGTAPRATDRGSLP